MKKLKTVLSIVLVLAMLFSFAACGKKEEAGGKTENASKYGGEFVACVGSTPGCLFYPKEYASCSTYVYPAVETIGHRNAKGEYEPWLAESWDIDLDAHTTTLYIRKGVKFHDGSDLNADVVKWNLDLIMELGNGSVIKNPTSIEKIDDYTVKITWGTFDLSQEAFVYNVLIYSKEAYEKNGLEWCITNPIGTGPFVLTENVADSHLTFTKFDNYWLKDSEGNQLPYLDSYKIQIIPDAAAQMTAFSNGDIDRFACDNLQITEAMLAQGYSNVAVAGEPNSAKVYGVYVNNKYADDPWAKVEVRQALLLYGIDWDKVAYVAGGKTAYQIMSPLIEIGPGYDADLIKESKLDVDKAKAMLKEAGYENGFSTQIMALDYGITAATEIQAQLKANYNIDATIVKLVNGDVRRFDGVERGIYLNYGYTTIDFAKHLTSMFNDKGTYKNVMVFSDGYLAQLQEMRNAKTKEEKDSLIRALGRKLTVEECLFRQMYAVPNAIFLQEYVHESGMERTVDGITPQTTWLDADKR